MNEFNPFTGRPIVGMYRVQFFTEYWVLRRFFTGSGYRVPNI